LWGGCHFSTSGNNSDVVKVPRSLLERLTDAVCYAAWMDKIELSFSQATLENNFGATWRPKKPGEICARLTSSINVYGRGSTPPLMPQAIDREGRHAKPFLSYSKEKFFLARLVIFNLFLHNKMGLLLVLLQYYKRRPKPVLLQLMVVTEN
jgi:hypothetical protein